MGIIIMGGPMSVNDENLFPWLKDEKCFIRNAIDQNTPLIGICLGAQMIADVMGASVNKNSHKEIGWHQGTLLNVKSIPQLSHYPPNPMFFHWHGEYFNIPSACIIFCKTTACASQGFFHAPNTFAFQFHPEVSDGNIQLMLSHCLDDIESATDRTYIQSVDEINAHSRKYIASSAKLYHEFLDKWHQMNLEKLS